MTSLNDTQPQTIAHWVAFGKGHLAVRNLGENHPGWSRRVVVYDIYEAVYRSEMEMAIIFAKCPMEQDLQQPSAVAHPSDLKRERGAIVAGEIKALLGAEDVTLSLSKSVPHVNV